MRRPIITRGVVWERRFFENTGDMTTEENNDPRT